MRNGGYHKFHDKFSPDILHAMEIEFGKIRSTAKIGNKHKTNEMGQWKQYLDGVWWEEFDSIVVEKSKPRGRLKQHQDDSTVPQVGR